VVFFAVALGFGVLVRALAREAACGERLADGVADALGEALALALGETLRELAAGLLGAVVGVRSRATCSDPVEPEVSWTAPKVPPTATATPTAAVATMPAGEENMRVRECLPATARSFRRLNKPGRTVTREALPKST